MTDREEAARLAAEGRTDLGRAPGDRAPGDEQHLASVVVATVGRPERLQGLVDAVLDDPGCAELIVAVDGPDSATLTELTRLADGRPRLKIVACEKRGQLAALDDGVAAAGSEVIVLLDDDITPAPGTISGHARSHAGRERLVVLGPMPIDLERAGSNAATRLYAAEYLGHISKYLTGEVAVLDELWMGNMSLRRSDCIRVGLRSETFREHYHQDRDVGYRLSEAGLTGLFDPSLTASHVHHRSDEAFLRDARRAGRAQAVLHRERPAKLGNFSADKMIEDLPSPVQAGVRLAASSRVAEPIAQGLMLCAAMMAKLRYSPGELLSVKLARRIMQYRGALDGIG
jgi:GT2 family glycosyltransferase